jgi:ABC-2 type transport system permease protein
MPGVDADGHDTLIPPTDERKINGPRPHSSTQKVGVAMEGRFKSFFTDNENPFARSSSRPRGLLERSPESARIVLYSSNDFMSDKVLNSLVAASGTQYLGPLDLLSNTLDWALQDEQLLQIRSRAHFNRTLPPMERQAQLLIEYFNYGLALLWLVVLALLTWLRRILLRRKYARGLAR